MIRIFATTIALVALPSLGFAMCTGTEHQAQSCATGMVWDSDTATCVAQVSG